MTLAFRHRAVAQRIANVMWAPRAEVVRRQLRVARGTYPGTVLHRSVA